MSSNFWQTKRQKEPFKNGQSVTKKVEEYCGRWEARCYSGGIPDEVSTALMNSFRVPSYKAIAIAILKNDLQLIGLGFEAVHYPSYDALLKSKNKDHPQMVLF